MLCKHKELVRMTHFLISIASSPESSPTRWPSGKDVRLDCGRPKIEPCFLRGTFCRSSITSVFFHDYLSGWIDGHIHKISPKMENPRDIAGNAEEEEYQCLKDRYSSGYPARRLALWVLCLDWLALCQYAVYCSMCNFCLYMVARLSRSVP